VQSPAAHAVSAPTGRWVVAAGGAARPRCGPTRNPWKTDIPHPLFAPEGRRRFLGRRKDACARRFLRPWRGGCVKPRTFPRVAHRPPHGGRCSTRGYSPPPRRGEERQFPVPRPARRRIPRHAGGLFPVPGSPFPVPASFPVPGSRLSPLPVWSSLPLFTAAVKKITL
jgi:hypothetical protein